MESGFGVPESSSVDGCWIGGICLWMKRSCDGFLCPFCFRGLGSKPWD